MAAASVPKRVPVISIKLPWLWPTTLIADVDTTGITAAMVATWTAAILTVDLVTMAFIAPTFLSVSPVMLTVIFVISMVLIPFAIINMREGLENLDGERIEMAESFTRSRWRRFCLIVLPSLTPFIFATIRISFGVAWKVALTAELFGGDAGLGYLLNLARQDFDMPLVIGVIVIIVTFVFLTERLIFQPLQSRLSRHHAHA